MCLLRRHVIGLKTWSSITILALASACTCPTNADRVAVSPNKYAAERDAACAAVEGCTADGLSDVRVFEVDTQSQAAELCQISNAYACYCFEAIGCQTSLLLPDAHSNALHEYVHAALDEVGIDTRDHGQLFEETLEVARKKVAAAADGGGYLYAGLGDGSFEARWLGTGWDWVLFMD